MSRRQKRAKMTPTQQPYVVAQHPLPYWWRNRQFALGIGFVLLIGIALVAWYAFSSNTTGARINSPPERTIGPATDCQRMPVFGERLGYGGRLAISTSERTNLGLVIFDGRIPLDAPIEQRAIHQEPSWDDAGALGPFVRDSAGNIYTAPVPRTAISDVLAGSQNTIYRVDSVSGEMAPFITLPNAPAPTSANPFGILGIAYDCEYDALYVSTVAGSTSSSEQGRIIRIDLKTKAITDEVIGVDAIGLGSFRGISDKRLYFGLAREATLASAALDENGHATGDIRNEINIGDVGAGIGEPRVRRLSFDPQAMILYIVPFNFNLRAVSAQQQAVLHYTYDPVGNTWLKIGAPTQ